MANRPLRVAWDNSLARRNPTGGGVYATQLIRELSANPGVDLKIFEGWDAKRRPGEFGSQSILARAKRGLNGLFWSHTYFPYMVRKENFDVVHSPAFVVPFICPCPSVVTFYDVTHLKFPEDFEARWRNYLNVVLPMSLRRASAIICISEHTRRDLLKHYKVAEHKLHVIYCGVDFARFHERVSLDREWANSIGLRPGYVLHVGAFSRRKNIPMLLRAVASLKAKGKFKDRQLVLAGPELSVLAGASEIRQGIRELDLQDTVVFTGHIPENQIAGLYAGARILVFPSLYEGFGLPVLEGMAVGTSVITSNASSMPEVAGDAAVLLPPEKPDLWADAIQDLIENDSRVKDLRRKGLVRARQFSWERAASETLDVYKKVAKRFSANKQE
jgi:glycosyltransferase involved in cell wall biosynthesis